MNDNCPLRADGTGTEDSQLEGGLDIDSWDPNIVDFSDWNFVAQGLSVLN